MSQRNRLEKKEYQISLLSAEDSHVSLLVLPGSERAKMMTVTSGRKWSELYPNCGLLGCLVKTLLESSAWHSTKCYLTWKAKTTPAKRLLYRLRASMPRTSATEHLLWPTPTTDTSMRTTKYAQGGTSLGLAVQMWPTPKASIRGDCPAERNRKSPDLHSAVMMYATPQARDYRTGQSERWENPDRSRNLNDQIGGRLNPMWVEWLMGFPTGWTDLNA